MCDRCGEDGVSYIQEVEKQMLAVGICTPQDTNTSCKTITPSPRQSEFENVAAFWSSKTSARRHVQFLDRSSTLTPWTNPAMLVRTGMVCLQKLCEL
jgi:hypothetical protein